MYSHSLAEIRFAATIIGMLSSSTKFLTTILIATILCSLLQIAWNNQATENLRIKNGFLLLAVFSTSATVVYLFLMNSAESKPQSFIRKYLASTVLKFMFYIMLLVLLLLFSKDNKPALILHFLFYYAVFTVLEVGFLYRDLKKFK